MKKTFLRFVLPATALLLAAAGCSRQAANGSSGGAPNAGLQAGAKAPAWSLKDLDGNEISSAQFAGKVVVVDFWATWCGPCVQEIPGYIAMQKKYGPQGFEIIGVSVDTIPPAKVKEFVKARGMNYTVVMADQAVQAAFGPIDAIPTTFLIDRDGVIRDRKLGAMPEEAYAKRVMALLK